MSTNTNQWQLMERTGCSWEEADDILMNMAEEDNDRRRDEEAEASINSKHYEDHAS